MPLLVNKNNTPGYKPEVQMLPPIRRRARPISKAYRDLILYPYPGDPKGRTGAELLALSVFREAVAGDVTAAREIAERVEGKVTDHIEIEDNTTEGASVIERILRLQDKLLQETNEGTVIEVKPGGDGSVPE